MALTGELSDLSLAELIELFCNQRKTGRLKVIYSVGPGYFYLQSGSVVHAKIGVLRGIEAVYFALTLPNASFTFSPAFDAPEQTINQHPFPDGHDVVEELNAAEPEREEPKRVEPEAVKPRADEQIIPAKVEVPAIPVLSQKLEKPLLKAPAAELPEFGAFLSHTDKANRFGSWKLITVMAAVALIIGAIAVPWGWYARSKAARLANEAQTAPSQNFQPATQPLTTNETAAAPEDSVSPAASSETTDAAAKRAREARLKERAAKAQEPGTALAPGQSTPPAVSPSAAKTQSSAVVGSKKAVVQVTYDENGRVTQASGGDATALRIARQKRFPAGKAGSATVTIPIN